MAEANSRLNDLLQKIAKEHGIQEPNIKMTAISTDGANFSSTLHLADVTSKGKTLKLFIKIATLNKTWRKLFGRRLFDTERIAYTSLFKTYRQLENKYGISEQHKILLPKFYGADETSEILVLEDLSSMGYLLQSRLVSVDWQFASSAITELAKFHALSLAYERENPREFNQMINAQKGTAFPDVKRTLDYFHGTAQTALNVVNKKHKEKLKKFIDSVTLHDLCYLNRSVMRTVLTHADFRPNNMLYRKTGNGETEVILVDYQTIRPGSPTMDLVYFVASATDGPFRKKHYQQLIDLYYSELSKALARLRLDVQKEYPREHFDFDLQKNLPSGLIFSLMALPLLTVSEGEASAVGVDLGFSDLAMHKTGATYSTRLSDAINDYAALGVLED